VDPAGVEVEQAKANTEATRGSAKPFMSKTGCPPLQGPQSETSELGGLVPSFPSLTENFQAERKLRTTSNEQPRGSENFFGRIQALSHGFAFSLHLRCSGLENFDWEVTLMVKPGAFGGPA
jgi:hypothetical protein